MFFPHSLLKSCWLEHWDIIMIPLFYLFNQVAFQVTVFLLLCLILVGAWLGYWGVHKLVLCEDGSVDESVAYCMNWSIWIFSAVMILQVGKWFFLFCLFSELVPLVKYAVFCIELSGYLVSSASSGLLHIDLINGEENFESEIHLSCIQVSQIGN